MDDALALRASAGRAQRARRCPLSPKIELMFFAGVARQSFGHAGSPPFGRPIKTDFKPAYNDY